MVAHCYRCQRPGHKANYCPHPWKNQPNELPDHANDSGKQAFSELPFNTQRWKNLKFSFRDAMFGLDQAETRRARVDVLKDLVSEGLRKWLAILLPQTAVSEQEPRCY